MKSTLSGALLGAFGLAGCASISGSDADPAVSVSADAPPPRRAPSRSADRYYHYTVAQYEARQGRIQDAISELKQTIAEDPDTAMLWVQLSQWLLRTGDAPGALDAAKKAVALEPTSQPARIAPPILPQPTRRIVPMDGRKPRVGGLR